MREEESTWKKWWRRGTQFVYYRYIHRREPGCFAFT